MNSGQKQKQVMVIYTQELAVVWVYQALCAPLWFVYSFGEKWRMKCTQLQTESDGFTHLRNSPEEQNALRFSAWQKRRQEPAHICHILLLCVSCVTSFECFLPFVKFAQHVQKLHGIIFNFIFASFVHQFVVVFIVAWTAVVAGEYSAIDPECDLLFMWICDLLAALVQVCCSGRLVFFQEKGESFVEKYAPWFRVNGRMH